MELRFGFKFKLGLYWPRVERGLYRLYEVGRAGVGMWGNEDKRGSGKG